MDADTGERLKVRVQFTDDAGNAERLTSAATGPVAAARPKLKVSVADARVREAAGATLDFAVTLSGPATDPVAVDYRTLDASAKAGQDYEARKGTLTFGAGETDKTLRVTCCDMTETFFATPQVRVLSGQGWPASRNRVLRGPGVTPAAKRTQEALQAA